MITKICKQCGKEFKVLSYCKNKSKFCSHQCYWKSKEGKPISNKKDKIKLICQQCGKEFLVKPFGKNRKFCSVNCRHEYYNGYVKKLNLVIEIDENHHFTKDGNYVEDDIKRQNLIENELNCKFLRIKDCEKNCISLNELKKELKNIYK